MRRLTAIGAFMVWIALIPADLRAQTLYDLGEDWSDVSNPNGVWTYREGTNALPSVADWTPLGAGAAQPAWAPSATLGNFIPAIMLSTTDNPGGLDILTGDVLVHSTDDTNGGTNGEANVAWTAPAAGTVDVSGAIWRARDINRTNDWALLLEGASLTSGSVFSGDGFDRANPMDFALGSGGANALTDIAVNAGDLIELLVTHDSTSGDFAGVAFAVALTEVPEPTQPMLLLTGVGVLLGAHRRRARGAVRRA